MGLNTQKVTPNSTINKAGDLVRAATERAAEIAPNASPLVVGTVPAAVDSKGKPSGPQAMHGRVTMPDGTEASKIMINPAVDAAYYAHELGHGVSQKTKIGRFMNDARHKIAGNPKLGNAIAMALTGGSAATVAALQEGNDDLAGSIALAAAVASPELIDEALASKNAPAIMENAGMRANRGQRGRLAGGFLSYVAPVVIAGSVGNTVGNLVDDYTALYNFGADQQTGGTLQAQ